MVSNNNESSITPVSNDGIIWVGSLNRIVESYTVLQMVAAYARRRIKRKSGRHINRITASHRGKRSGPLLTDPTTNRAQMMMEIKNDAIVRKRSPSDPTSPDPNGEAKR